MNPLSIFRRYQKLLLVVFGVLLMISFTIGASISQWVAENRGGGGGSSNEVVVKWDGGSIREFDMTMLRQKRNAMLRFLQVAQQTAVQRGATPPRLPLSMSDAEEVLVGIELMSDEAEKLGLQVDDLAIEGYLQYATAGELTSPQLGEIFQNVTQNQMSRIELFEIIRKELLANRYQSMLTSGQSLPPGLAWDYYNRLNRRVTAEVLPLEVEDEEFLSRVGQPKETELRMLYEENKTRYPSQASAEPGFKSLPKAKFQFIKFEYKRFLDDAVAKVSDEDVKKYYEENKDSFRDSTSSSEETGLDEASSDGESDETSDVGTPDEGIETEPTGDSGEASGDAEPSTDAEPSDAGDSAASDESPDEPAADDSSKNQLNTLRTIPVAFQDSEVPGEKTPAPESGEVPNADDLVAPPEDGISESDLDVPESTTDPEADSQDEPATEATDDQPTSDAATGEEPTEDANVEEASEPEEIRYQPLEDVADSIRKDLAKLPAQEAFEAAINAARAKLADYKNDFLLWEVNKIDDKDAKQPPAPDFEQIATTYNAIAGSTPLLDILEIQEEVQDEDGEGRKLKYEISAAYQLDYARAWQQISFLSIAYNKDFALYEVKEVRHGESVDDRFLFWKTESEAEKVPTFEEAREKVELAWKKSKALEFAKEKAEQLAKQANDEGKTLSEAFKDIYDVTETNEFSWLSQGMVAESFAPPRISFVDGVEYPGNEFMQSVFDLDIGEIGSAVNYPESIVYVVYVKSKRSDELLRDQFFTQGVTMPVRFVASQENQRNFGEWYKDFQKEHNVEWVRDPLPASGSRM